MPDRTISEMDYDGFLFATRVLNSLYKNGVRGWEGYDVAFNQACDLHDAKDDSLPDVTPGR